MASEHSQWKNNDILRHKSLSVFYFLNKNKRLFFPKYFACNPSGKKFVADLVVVGFLWFVGGFFVVVVIISFVF